MSVNRVVSGGDSQLIWLCGSGTGINALPIGVGDTGEHDQSYNREESPGPSNPQLDNTTQQLGLCPFGTSGRWLCGTQC